MKKILVGLLLVVSTLTSWAYSFSAVAPSGQTLYYDISGSNAIVTCPRYHYDSYDAYCHYDWYGYVKPTGSLVIPATITYNNNIYTINRIKDHAFNECTGLIEVVIPNTVTDIDSYTFYGCSGLASVTIPNSVTSDGYGAFRDCSGLMSLIIPNLVTSDLQVCYLDCENTIFRCCKQHS